MVVGTGDVGGLGRSSLAVAPSTDSLEETTGDSVQHVLLMILVSFSSRAVSKAGRTCRESSCSFTSPWFLVQSSSRLPWLSIGISTALWCGITSPMLDSIVCIDVGCSSTRGSVSSILTGRKGKTAARSRCFFQLALMEGEEKQMREKGEEQEDDTALISTLEGHSSYNTHPIPEIT